MSLRRKKNHWWCQNEYLYTRYGQLSLHSGLIVGFLILSTWAWNVICAPEVFAWYFGFTILNVGQLLYLLYRMRPIRFDEDLEAIYVDLFAPLNVTRHSALKWEKSAISRVQNPIFCTRKKFKTTKNAIFGLKKKP